MFERLKRLFRREDADPERLREEAENRYSAEQESRAAEQAKSEQRRGYEGSSERPPYFRP
jgi:hypothetical protein